MPIPESQSKTKPPYLTGTVEFNCCGIRQKQDVKTGDLVKCQYCHEAYTIWLHKVQVAIYQDGWRAYDICTPVETILTQQYGADFKLEPETEYQVANDAFNFLGIDNTELPILVQHPLTPELTLILRVPKSQLRKVSHVGQDHATQDQTPTS